MASALNRAVAAFLEGSARLTERELEGEWAWREYDDGVRHAFFRTYEELRGLAVIIADRRQVSQPLTSAQRILAQVHQAQIDLDAVLLGVTDDLGGTAPTEGEWSVQQTMRHIIGTERQFYGRIHYAVERQRSGTDRPLEMPEDELETFIGAHLNREALAPLPLTAVRLAMAGLHDRILTELVDFSDDDLLAPSVWWEERPYDVRFRMHRFDSHLRQHTVQIEKILVALREGPSEAKRLARLVLGALAEVEGNLLGAPEVAADLIQEFVDELGARTASVAASLLKIR